MNFCVPTAPKVEVVTEHGIARQVFVDGIELKMVTDVDISYGIQDLPKVRVEFFGSVKVHEKEEADN